MTGPFAFGLTLAILWSIGVGLGLGPLYVFAHGFGGPL